MNFEKYTIKSQEAIQRGQQIALEKEHQSIELENSASVLLFPAYLLVALPKSIEDDSYSMSRYSDKVLAFVQSV